MRLLAVSARWAAPCRSRPHSACRVQCRGLRTSPNRARGADPGRAPCLQCPAPAAGPGVELARDLQRGGASARPSSSSAASGVHYPALRTRTPQLARQLGQVGRVIRFDEKSENSTFAVDQAHGAKLHHGRQRVARRGGVHGLRADAAEALAMGADAAAVAAVTGGVCGSPLTMSRRLMRPASLMVMRAKKSRLVLPHCTLGVVPGRWPRSGRAGSGSSRPAAPRPPALRSWGGCRGAVGLEVFNGRVARQLQAGALIGLRKRHLPAKAHIGAQQFNGQLLGQVAVQPMQGTRVASSLPWVASGCRASVPWSILPATPWRCLPAVARALSENAPGLPLSVARLWRSRPGPIPLVPQGGLGVVGKGHSPAFAGPTPTRTTQGVGGRFAAVVSLAGVRFA